MYLFDESKFINNTIVIVKIVEVKNEILGYGEGGLHHELRNSKVNIIVGTFLACQFHWNLDNKLSEKELDTFLEPLLISSEEEWLKQEAFQEING